ncbi:MAG TPA: PKD domain-containing protein [Cyclobacteriaceae bacterium]|nr:PKD domain-containing protein [Cyclobacteriaceae bacterium]HRJ81334.1 PKD domain-containing protein [Cyclobacteriaceae bacterium]
MPHLRLFIFTFWMYGAFAQCPITNFTLPASACIGQGIELLNQTTGGTSYSWDFCSGDLDLTPQVAVAANNNLLFRTRAFRIITHNELWYGFTIDQAANKLIRLDFGSSLSGTPTVNDLGNPSNLLNGAFDFRMYYESNQWFALVVNTTSNSLLRLSFGSDIESVPTVQNLGSFGVLNTPNGIFIVQENEFLRVFVTNGGVAEIIRFDFGTSIFNNPTVVTFNVTGASGLRGIAITRECDRWFGLVTSYNNNKVFWLDFVNGLSQPPTTGEITFFTSYSFPASIVIADDGGEYYAFIQSAIGVQYKLSFGSSIMDKNGTGQNLGNFGISNENFALEMVKVNSDWIGFSIDLANRRLVRQTFPSSCDATFTTSHERDPPLISYGVSGSKKITLKATDVNGSIRSVSKTITISAGLSPDISFLSQNVCADHAINFTSVNTSGNITSYEWDFGDAGTSSLSNPTHVYATAGSYDARLTVTASNGCSNLAREQLTIFNQPVADFVLPAVSPICTNQSYLFSNSTIFDAALIPTWEWSVNGTSVSTTQNLEFLFANAVSQEIKLKATIPGCTSEIIESISTVVPGPTVDFSFNGQCEDAPVSFTNTTTGDVSSFAWDFGDGQNSTAVNPVTAFSNPGTYPVNLAATNAAGCVNTKSKPITIYSKPQTNFSVALPPFSCSGTPTQFTDLTPNPFDSNITSWLWNFGEGGTSTLRNPQHTFTNAGGYNVSLTATTNFGCSSVLEKPVTISQSPIANFTNTPPCLGVPVSFTNTSTGTLQSQQWQIESTFYTLANPVHAFTSSGNKSVTLNVTATNGCVASVNRTLIVPNTISPDFTFTRNCINQQTEFTSNTVNPADPITGYNWNFAGLGTGNFNPQNFSFNNTGNFNVSLSVTTQTGCVYSVAKNVSIINAPQANFTATPSVGPPPLQVQFTNTSVNATSYSWAFNDPTNSTSTLVSPSFTYTTLGQYVADLTAFNAQGCSTIFSRVIHVVIPVIDVALTEMELMRLPNQSLKPAVTIQNKSNVALANLSLRMELNGTFIRDIVPVSIEPNSTYRHVFDFELQFTSTLQTVCVHAEINDSSPEDNRICASVDEPFVFLAPYPNPLSSQSEINVEWVASDNRNTEILLVNSLGQQVKRLEATSSIGYNVMIIPGSGLQSGMYYVQIRYGSIIRTHRILVAD